MALGGRRERECGLWYCRKILLRFGGRQGRVCGDRCCREGGFGGRRRWLANGRQWAHRKFWKGFERVDGVWGRRECRRGPFFEGRELGYLFLWSLSVLLSVFLSATGEAAVQTSEEGLHEVTYSGWPRCRGSSSREGISRGCGEEERGDGAHCSGGPAARLSDGCDVTPCHAPSQSSRVASEQHTL